MSIIYHCPVSCCVPEPSGDGTWVSDVVPCGGFNSYSYSYTQSFPFGPLLVLFAFITRSGILHVSILIGGRALFLLPFSHSRRRAAASHTA